MTQDQALVLLSGGQDSTTCLAVACAKHPGAVSAVAIDYGQRHQVELDCARKIADVASVPLTVIDITVMSKITSNALTRPDIAIEHKDGELPSTFVPGRNLIFLNFAAVVAFQNKISTIYIGVCEADYSGYPDCRDAFIKSAETTINLALDSPLKIEAPLMRKTKAQTVQMMADLGKIDWYRQSHTCYEGTRPACGVCPACQLRLKGFQTAGIEDPIDYVTREVSLR